MPGLLPRDILDDDVLGVNSFHDSGARGGFGSNGLNTAAPSEVNAKVAPERVDRPVPESQSGTVLGSTPSSTTGRFGQTRRTAPGNGRQGTAGIAIRRRPEFDALKYNRALGRHADRRDVTARDGHPVPASRGSCRTPFEGFIPFRVVRYGPKEMRIPPLRSAVQMGSDVSPGSSVLPGRSDGPWHRTWTSRHNPPRLCRGTHSG